jgi:hypothetical protein
MGYALFRHFSANTKDYQSLVIADSLLREITAGTYACESRGSKRARMQLARLNIMRSSLSLLDIAECVA